MTSAIIVGTPLYAVTQHNVVIDLEAVSINVEEDCPIVKTKVVDETDGYAETHQRLRFKAIMIVEGELMNDRIFTDENAAFRFAIEKQGEKQAELENNLAVARTHLFDLHNKQLQLPKSDT